MNNYKENSNCIHKKNSEPISKMNSTHLAKVVSLPKLERRILNCTKKLRGKLIVYPSEGVQIKMTNRNKILTKVSAVGPNFPMKMTWERLILLSLSQKQPKNIFPDTGGAAYG